MTSRPERSIDHRYARPPTGAVTRLRSHPLPAPTYRARYTHWWVHPYYRHYRSARVVVGFPFYVQPWTTWWTPPPRPRWIWLPGTWVMGHWLPGRWRPVGPPPVVGSIRFVWVDGWWQDELYIEGYWRTPSRGPDWVWVDGHYLEDGVYVPGYWRPAASPPAGYVWVPGFWDGEVWVEGFWRPRVHRGYVWVPGHFNDDGVYAMGYWEPESDRPGYVWVPGWFDGHAWIPGEWVEEREYRETDVQSWRPPAGWDRSGTSRPSVDEEPPPLALPADD